MDGFGKTRREFIKDSICLGAAALAVGPTGKLLAMRMAGPGSRMKFGLVTYQWGKDWDLPTLIANCEKAKVLGVELRVEHAHKVESNLNAQQRIEVKKRFADSPVVLVGMGTNFAFHDADPAKLKGNIETAKEYLKLSADVGGSGVKVKPNDLPKGVAQAKTIEQIGKSLNEIGKFGADIGQKVRLEVHGGCSPLPIIKAIMDVADHPNVGVCWNCNSDDLKGEGLEHNFNLVKGRFGDTAHVRELNAGDYPYQELMNLFAGMDYAGWILLEGRADPKDKVAALIEQRQVWEGMIAKAQPGGAKGGAGVKISEADNKLRVEIDGKLFTEYNYQDVPRPFFYPVIGPTGVNVTRNWPMKDINKDEERDHVHHKSLWFTHGAVNGQDFWAESGKSGKVVHDGFVKVESGAKAGVIESKNKWVAKDGAVVCTDTRTHRFYPVLADGGRMMDFEITIHASQGKVVLGDTKEGSMAIRLAPTMRVEDKEGKVAKGHIINSEGVKDGDAWGKRAAWCDCYGPVEDKVVGVAIFDHPTNPKHPTWWHVRTYGLFAANPFGEHDFEKKPAGAGDITIEAGKSLTFKYRLYFHNGDAEQGQVAKYYRAYAATK